MTCLLLIGLDKSEYLALMEHLDVKTIRCSDLPPHGPP